MRTVKVAFLVGLMLASVDQIAEAQTEAQIRSVTIPQIVALEREKASRPPWQHKVDSQLLYLMSVTSSGHASSAAPALRAQAVPSSEMNQMTVDIQGQITDQVIAAVQSSGGQVISNYSQNGQLRARIPIDSIVTLADLPEIRSIQPKAEGMGHQASNRVDREGIVAHAVDEVQDIHRLGVLGEGVTIGVLSDSLDDGAGSLQRAYDQKILDKSLVSVVEGQGGSGRGEGLAMVEIIHAIAPKSKIIFATALGVGDVGGPMLMENNIYRLKELGAQIIVDDFTYYLESPFQVSDHDLSGVIGKAVQDVSSQGVLYFSAARNAGNQNHKTSGTWEGDFADGGVVGNRLVGAASAGHFHKFEFGVTLNTADDAGYHPRVDLFWADPLGAARNDYELFVVDRMGRVISSSAENTGEPYRSVPLLHSGESVVVVRAPGSDSRFIHLDIGDGALRHSTSGSVRGHDAVASPNALTVAAARAPGSGPFSLGPGDSVESFSSDGPRRIFFDADGKALTPGVFTSVGGKLLHKPDITAADVVSTSLPTGSDLNPFKGTSAAAPQAAGIAALLLSCKPTPTPASVRDAIEQTAEPIEGNEQNDTAGYGVIMANAAAAKLCKSPQ